MKTFFFILSQKSVENFPRLLNFEEQYSVCRDLQKVIKGTAFYVKKL